MVCLPTRNSNGTLLWQKRPERLGCCLGIAVPPLLLLFLFAIPGGFPFAWRLGFGLAAVAGTTALVISLLTKDGMAIDCFARRFRRFSGPPPFQTVHEGAVEDLGAVRLYREDVWFENGHSTAVRVAFRTERTGFKPFIALDLDDDYRHSSRGAVPLSGAARGLETATEFGRRIAGEWGRELNLPVEDQLNNPDLTGGVVNPLYLERITHSLKEPSILTIHRSGSNVLVRYPTGGKAGESARRLVNTVAPFIPMAESEELISIDASEVKLGTLKNGVENWRTVLPLSDLRAAVPRYDFTSPMLILQTPTNSMEIRVLAIPDLETLRKLLLEFKPDL